MPSKRERLRKRRLRNKARRIKRQNPRSQLPPIEYKMLDAPHLKYQFGAILPGSDLTGPYPTTEVEAAEIQAEVEQLIAQGYRFVSTYMCELYSS